MSRLIDADLLIEIVKNVREHIKETNENPVAVDAVDMFSLFVEMIDNQKTAYDIDKVVEQLEGEIEFIAREYPLHGRYIKKSRAIEIVKGGE